MTGRYFMRCTEGIILLHDQQFKSTITLGNERTITREILSLFFNGDYQNFSKRVWNNDILYIIKSYHLKEEEMRLSAVGNKVIYNIFPMIRTT